MDRRIDWTKFNLYDEEQEVKVNWSIIMFAVYALGSICFLAGSAIGIAMQMGWLK